MEEQLSPLAVTHLLQHTLRSLCIHEDSQWVYAVFWRILPRNYPPPMWDLQGGAYDRSRGNRRNWILVWEDGFCNFAACAGNCAGPSASAGSGSSGEPHHFKGLLPELFFKMSHEIYSFGEGLIGRVAADHSHKWVFKEPQDNGISLLYAWQNPTDSHPRTWEAQFQSGIEVLSSWKHQPSFSIPNIPSLVVMIPGVSTDMLLCVVETIALIAVGEGVIQLGAVNKVMEDLSFVILLRNKFSYLESIPGVLLPHPSSYTVPSQVEGCNAPENWPELHTAMSPAPRPPSLAEFHHHLVQQARTTPSISSFDHVLLPGLACIGGPSWPALVPPGGYSETSLPSTVVKATEGMRFDMITKVEVLDNNDRGEGSTGMAGRSSSHARLLRPH